MSAGPARRICLAPALSGVGGMVSFQGRLAAGLIARGYEVAYDLDGGPYAGVLVIGGTRRLAALRKLRRQGTRIVQRLDGINWLHRRRSTGLRHYLRSEYGNWLLALIRRRLAHGIVYQSRFARGWWERVYGPVPVPATEIHNGVDLHLFTDQPWSPPVDRVRILMVEGSLMGGYELGLESGAGLALELGRLLSEGSAHMPESPQGPPSTHSAGLRDQAPAGRHMAAHSHIDNMEAQPFANCPVELSVAGRVQPAVQQRWEAWLAARASAGQVSLRWEGLVPHERIPHLDRSAHLFFSGDINAACPNAAIESLACGTPVVAFTTGALPELLAGQGGRLAPYGGDPWRLDRPDIPGLAQAALSLLADLPAARAAARRRAEAALDVNQMVEAYLGFLLEG